MPGDPLFAQLLAALSHLYTTFPPFVTSSAGLATGGSQSPVVSFTTQVLWGCGGINPSKNSSYFQPIPG